MAGLLCIGDLNLDIAITVAGAMVPGSDNEGTIETFGGGSAANVAAWAARAGLPTRFVGVVGADVSGDFLIDELAAYGVDVVAIRREDDRTGSVAVVIGPDGDRSMVSDRTSSMCLEPKDVRSEWFADVDGLHLTAYTWFNERSRATFTTLIDMAHARSVPVSIDPSAAALMRDHGDAALVLEAFGDVDILFPNRDEAAFLSGIDDPVRAAEALLDTAATVVVTCGADGAHIARRSEPTIHIPVVPAEVVNALGCGDAFVGGFLAGRLSGQDDITCGTAGAHSAARALQLRSAR